MPAAAPKPDPEFQALVRSRYAGNPRAIGELGARVLVGRDAPQSPADGAALIAEAAQQGDAAAWCHMAVLAATGVGRPHSWADAWHALEQGATLGCESAVRQRELLRTLGLSPVDVEEWLRPPEAHTVLASPRLIHYPDFLPSSLCGHLLARASAKLEPARVVDARGGGLKRDPMRTNSGAVLSFADGDLIALLVRARIARTAGVAAEALEPTEVLHYAAGETYKPHVDFFHPALPQFADEMRLRGQRVKTCLVYLNDDFAGGETDFPKIGIRFRGQAGEALLFENVLPNGAGDMRTVHAGLPPSSGEKWLLSQWIRSKPQRIA